MRNKVDLYVIDKVRERRLEKGYTQEALSYALIYSRTFISQFEIGNQKYNVHHLNQIANILKCSPRDFLPENPLLE